MNKSKKPLFFCSQLNKDVSLDLLYTQTPGDTNSNVLIKFDCKDVCIECGVAQEINQNKPKYNWEKCPAHNEYVTI